VVVIRVFLRFARPDASRIRCVIAFRAAVRSTDHGGFPKSVNHFQHYLLEEFVEDYREGRMRRREFVMKVIGVAGGLAAATGVFSSVGLSAAEIAAAQAEPRLEQDQPNAVTVPPDDPSITVADVQFAAADGANILGYLATPSAPGSYAGVVVIHENRGLLEHHKDVVRRYAKAGFAAVAPDLLSRDGGTGNINPDDAPGLISRADPERHVMDATAAGVFVQSQAGVRSDAHGITGFCFGGGVVWHTIAEDLSVAAAIPFYGPAPQPSDIVSNTRAATLAFYGGQDANVTPSQPGMMAALDAAGVPHDYMIYPDAKHGFFNDTGASYNAAAAADAWMRALAWFHQYLPPTM
jgi:carboxymethylenebutenolidase